ncbi:MAG TPA: enoyl-CoA hydratase-related protein [Pseudolabrys sp.]|nr:enoyl-CoA hydratase-related protein [Pseudolabrys sp.]
MSMPSSLLTITAGARGIITVTLNRPDKGNALNADMLVALDEACERFERDDSVRVVVLRGAGKHFCAGADVAGGIGDSPVSVAEICERFDRLGKPTIAAIHGACIGAGVAFAASCDAVLATPAAFFAIPEVKLGFPPAELMPLFLRALGPRRLRRYCLAGDRFDAQAAREAGLVHALHDEATLDSAVRDLADVFLQAAPGAVRTAKTLLRQLAAGEAVDLHAVHAQAVAGDEAREGVASFRERRHPRWYLPHRD